MADVVKVPIREIGVGEHNLREGVDDESIRELANSIQRVGLINPLRVVRCDDGYLVVAGHRRLAASKIAGMEEVDCVVQGADGGHVAEVALAENIFRADLSAVEVAAAIKELYESESMGLSELAAACHRSERWVEAQMGMLDWPGDVLRAVHERRLSVSAAKNLASVSDEEYRVFLVKQAVENGATARITAAWLQAYKGSLPQEEAVSVPGESAGTPAPPVTPRAPCIVCGEISRPDGLCSVMICTSCLSGIRQGLGGGG